MREDGLIAAQCAQCHGPICYTDTSHIARIKMIRVVWARPNGLKMAWIDLRTKQEIKDDTCLKVE